MTRRLLPLVLCTISAVYALVIRPWLLRWGSTDSERVARLPGDDVEPAATYVTTRAVTIEAPAVDVWPWLVQMGQDRAGFYTHNWVERLLRSGIPDVQTLHAEWQHIAVGDLMRTNHDMGDKALGWPVLAVYPGRALVLQSRGLPRGTYAFVLQRIDERRTRLIVRDRAAWRRWEWPFAVLVYEPLHGYMETGLLTGLRERAEREARATEDRHHGDLEVAAKLDDEPTDRPDEPVGRAEEPVSLGRPTAP
jgi:hypothetical protein